MKKWSKTWRDARLAAKNRAHVVGLYVVYDALATSHQRIAQLECTDYLVSLPAAGNWLFFENTVEEQIKVILQNVRQWLGKGPRIWVGWHAMDVRIAAADIRGSQLPHLSWSGWDIFSRNFKWMMNYCRELDIHNCMDAEHYPATGGPPGSPTWSNGGPMKNNQAWVLTEDLKTRAGLYREMHQGVGVSHYVWVEDAITLSGYNYWWRTVFKGAESPTIWGEDTFVTGDNFGDLRSRVKNTFGRGVRAVPGVWPKKNDSASAIYNRARGDFHKGRGVWLFDSNGMAANEEHFDKIKSALDWLRNGRRSS